MNRFSMWFADFMRGRYGTDQLNRFLCIVVLVLIIIGIFIRWRIIDIITVLLLIYLYCRMFSRNISARARENQKFMEFFAKGDKTHKILRCEGCGERLRVPKGAGVIRIKCPHCGIQFTKKV